MAATWTVLGAGTILPRKGLGCAGYALRPARGEKVTLFDCGPGTLRMLAEVGIALAEVERVVISHFHLDHCLDLFSLAFARHSPSFRPLAPLEIVGPVGLALLFDRGEHTLGEWAKNPEAAITEVSLDTGGRATLEREGMRLTCVATRHTSEALAWRADLADGASVCYSGDTKETPEVAELAREVDLFACECSHADGHGVPGHLTPSSAARLAARAACRKLLLTHFYPPLEPEDACAAAARSFNGAIEAARDGAVHVLARVRV